MAGRSDHDPFDLGFEADDDFAPRGRRSLARRAGGALAAPTDPFADFPPVRPREALRAVRRAAAGGSALHAQARAGRRRPPRLLLRPRSTTCRSRPRPRSRRPPIRSAPTQALVQEVIAAADADMGEAAVPRITIHAFCGRPETIAAGRGRRGRPPDGCAPRPSPGPAAWPPPSSYYQNQPTPSLVHGREPGPPRRACWRLLDQPGRGLRPGHQGRGHRLRPTTSPSIAS